MQQLQFLRILESISLLTPEQVITLRSSLSAPDTLDMTPGTSQVLEAAAAHFHDSPYCPVIMLEGGVIRVVIGATNVAIASALSTL